MKTTLDQKTLSDAVAWAARALPGRPAVPVLSGILIEADTDGLTLSVFDYDVSARVTIPADVAEPGRAVVPGRVLAEITKSLPNLPVELAVTGMEATITCGSAEFGLLTMPVDDYPTLPEVPPAVGTVDGRVLQAAVEQVTPAASKDDTLPMLVCCRIDILGDMVTVAATDRYRIAARTFTWERHTQADHGVMVPARVLHDVARGITPAYPVQIGLDSHLIAFTSAGRTTTARLLNEQYIDYNARLADTYATHVELDLPQLIDAVKRVALVAERNTAVRLAFCDDELTIRAGGGDVGRGSETIPCTVDGTDMEIAFQPHYLLDALTGTAVTADRVRIGLESPNKPALVTPATDGTPDFRELVMSLRLA